MENQNYTPLKLTSQNYKLDQAGYLPEAGWNTLPETNIALKIGLSKRKLVFQPSIFRGYVSFREGIPFLDYVTPFQNSNFMSPWSSGWHFQKDRNLLHPSSSHGFFQGRSDLLVAGRQVEGWKKLMKIPKLNPSIYGCSRIHWYVLCLKKRPLIMTMRMRMIQYSWFTMMMIQSMKTSRYGGLLKWWYPHFTPQNDHF